MGVRGLETWPSQELEFLRRCYRFVNVEWQHHAKSLAPDQGFEERFRESCVKHLAGWTISHPREMGLGLGYQTASGILHELDIVAQHPEVTVIAELKNRQGDPPEKNDVITFFAKILDYVAANADLAAVHLGSVFMSNTFFEQTGLAACIGLGIHPIAPGLRPIPILVESAYLMDLDAWARQESRMDLVTQLDDFSAEVNSLTLATAETWFPNRCGRQSEHTIVVEAFPAIASLALAKDLLRLNGDCGLLLERFRKPHGSTRT